MTLLCSARCRPKPAGPREAAPGFRLCWVCKDGMASSLRDLIELCPDLEDALSRANAVGGEKVSGSPGSVSELNERAAAVRWQIHHDMVTTIRLIMDERGLVTITRAPDIAGMARWLLNHVDWLAAHPSAGKRAAECASWPGLARNAIHPNPPKHVKIGPCVIDDCTGTLSAIVKPQDSLLPSEIVCSWWQEFDQEVQRERAELDMPRLDAEALVLRSRMDPRADGGKELEPHAWSADQWHALGRQMQRRVHVR